MNTVAAILIIISGNSYGDTTSVTRFETMDECTKALTIVEETFKNVSFWGRTFRHISCKPL